MTFFLYIISWHDWLSHLFQLKVHSNSEKVVSWCVNKSSNMVEKILSCLLSLLKRPPCPGYADAGKLTGWDKEFRCPRPRERVATDLGPQVIACLVEWALQMSLSQAWPKLLVACKHPRLRTLFSCFI